MFSLKNVLIFLAGAAFFHTLSHILLPIYLDLPLQIKGMVFTSTMNNWAIAFSGAVTVVLLWFASKAKS